MSRCRLVGQYKHTFDQKNRIIIPSKFRSHLGDSFIAAAILDHCVRLYPNEEWDRLQDKLEELPETESRNLILAINSRAQEVSVDAQGRISLEPRLIEYAQIDKEALFVGSGRHAKLWNPANYEKVNLAMTDEEMEAKLLELGF